MKKYILLDNIRSLLNVGAIFRTVDGAGFNKVILTGFTPTPPRKEISKTAIGAEQYVDWEYYEDPVEILKELKKQGFKIITVEQTQKSIDFRKLEIRNENICLVLGNEIEGVNKKIVELSDYCVELPMLGQKQSLNVATTAGIMLYRFLD
ncbi:MAG: RNA methyltransferase [Candidatus Gracilibacteria bacterium]|nr:RNA methyltransferase [Candidatus Gracilibacteria bacterium]